MALTQSQIDAVETAAATTAAGPAEMTTEAGHVKAQPIPDLIEAERFEKTKQARSANSSPLAGLRISKAGLPGTTGDA